MRNPVHEVPGTRLYLLAAVFTLGTSLTGCGGGGDDPNQQNAVVFESRGILQCQAGGTTPQASSMKLIGAGIDVLRSGCGVLTNVTFAAMCGGPTGELVMHQIRKVNLADAERLGFESVDGLRNPTTGKGYDWVDCATGAIVP